MRSIEEKYMCQRSWDCCLSVITRSASIDRTISGTWDPHKEQQALWSKSSLHATTTKPFSLSLRTTSILPSCYAWLTISQQNNNEEYALSAQSGRIDNRPSSAFSHPFILLVSSIRREKEKNHYFSPLLAWLCYITNQLRDVMEGDEERQFWHISPPTQWKTRVKRWA